MTFRLCLLLSLLFIHSLRAATALDFSNYRFGYNNRGLFESIINDLVSEFGHPVSTAYGKDLKAKIDRIVIDETQMDKYLSECKTSREREAVARFILAHEYFHVALKHPQTVDRIRAPREIEIIGPYSEARKQMERQVDYLAAKYLYKLDLPTEPIQQIFLKHPEFHGGEEYPSATERAHIVTLAKRSGIDESYFDHKAIRCTFLLSSLATKLP